MVGVAGRHRLEPGSIAVFHLIDPSEKLWGVLEHLDTAGVILRGINLSSFDDWMRQVARAGEEEPTLGLSTLFVPLFRVERIYLDESAGGVVSYRERFEARVGRSPESELLG